MADILNDGQYHTGYLYIIKAHYKSFCTELIIWNMADILNDGQYHTGYLYIIKAHYKLFCTELIIWNMADILNDGQYRTDDTYINKTLKIVLYSIDQLEYGRHIKWWTIPYRWLLH